MIGAESVGSNAFSGCISLKRVNCPKLTYIKDGAFKDCAKLQELPSESIFSFGSSAFKNCISLTKASSRGCSSLSDSAFSGCTALTSISFLSLSVIGNHAFEGCSELLEANLDSLRTVGEGAFKNCKRLESFPFEKMKTIGAYAFQNCTSLSTVTISGTVSIAQGAFCGCTALKSFSASKILDGYIHDEAFSGCCQLKEVAPTTLRYVGAGSFSSCKLLNANFVLGDVYSRAFYAAITDTANPATIVFQPFTKSLGDNAFYGGKAIKCIYSFADTPPVCGKNAFKGVPADIPVYVNYHSILKYKTADVWKDFTNIQCTEIVEGGVRYRIVDSNNAVVVGYDKTTVLKTINFVFGKVGESDKTAINQAYGQEVVTEFGINLISCLTIKKAVTIMSRQFEVTSINPGTFKNTLECLSISLGGSQITSKAFAGCTEFKAIVVSSSTPPIVAADAFVASKQSKETFLIVPKNAVDNYKKAAVWNRFRIVSFDCPFKVDTLQLTALDNRLKQEILKHYIHDRLKDNLQDLLGLVSGNWRDIPQLLADKKDFSKAASELFDKVNNVPNGFELILPDSIKDRLDGANTQLGNGILRDAVQSLGKVQLYGSIGEKIDIEKYIKTPGGLVADLVIDGRLEIKDVIAKPITPLKKASFRPIRIINRIVTLLNPVFEYEDNLSIAAQRFTDMLQSQLSPYFADKKYQVVKPGKEMSQVKKGQVFIGLHLSDKAAQMKADLLK